MADMNKVRDAYDAFVRQGSQTATALSNKNFSKMCKDCKVADGKKLTSADIDITFSKHKTKGQLNISYEQFVAVMREMGAKKYGLTDADKIFTLIEGRSPQALGVTTTSRTGGVAHLTDTSQYTGAHKSRFDQSGKGKGLEGREERADYSGYVSGYKEKGTYDEKNN